MLIAPVTTDEYYEFLEQQQQDALDAGEGYLDENLKFVPYEKQED